MLDPAQLHALAAVHRRGAFDLAAADLGVTPSAVSQRIRALEERIGTLVLRRGPPAEATAAGLRLIRHHDELVLMERALGQELPALGQGAAHLKIAVNADSLASWFLPALARVEGLIYELVIDDQEHSQDWLRRGEVSAAVTAHPGPLQGCETIALGRLRYLATASPAYMQRWFGGDQLWTEAFTRAPALRFNAKDQLQEDWARAQGLDLGFPAHVIGSSQAFIDAARLGLGWGMNIEIMVRGLLDSGELVELRPGAVVDVPLYWQFARLSAPATADLTRAIRSAAREALLPV